MSELVGPEVDRGPNPDRGVGDAVPPAEPPAEPPAGPEMAEAVAPVVAESGMAEPTVDPVLAGPFPASEPDGISQDGTPAAPPEV